MNVGTAEYSSAPGEWIKFEYREFWDFARLFHLTYKGLHLVFHSPFLDIPSEYADHFIIYKSAELDVTRWSEAYRKWEVANIVAVDTITLDEGKRDYILAESLDRMFAKYEWPNHMAQPTPIDGRG